MKVISDLHFHSRFSRAVSPQMNIPVISEWASKKGIGLMATGDWTHPIWFRELKANLQEVNQGIYKYKEGDDKTKFLLSTEVSCIYSKSGKGRRVHLLVFSPCFDVSEKINKEISLRGGNLLSDGRPMLGLSAKNILEITLGIDKNCLVIPSHAWTPHYSVFGNNSGFDSLEECFEELTSEIKAVETGLSSDPAMNWRIVELRGRSIVSFSDAHSPAKLGREATVFEMPEVTYENVRKAISQEGKDSKIAYTIEFYPEEGKYHYTGHRNCNVVYSPNEARKNGIICPVCGKLLTVGVMSRVEELAREEIQTQTEKDENGVLWIRNKNFEKPAYVMIVPLLEIIAEALDSTVSSQKSINLFNQLVNTLGGEFRVLLKAKADEIKPIAGERLVEGIMKVRSGDIVIKPGFDGVFGTVKIWKDEKTQEEKENILSQETLF